MNIRCSCTWLFGDLPIKNRHCCVQLIFVCLSVLSGSSSIGLLVCSGAFPTAACVWDVSVCVCLFLFLSKKWKKCYFWMENNFHWLKCTALYSVRCVHECVHVWMYARMRLPVCVCVCICEWVYLCPCEYGLVLYCTLWSPCNRNSFLFWSALIELRITHQIERQSVSAASV